MKNTYLGIMTLMLLMSPVAYGATVDDYYNVDDRISKMKADLNLNDEQVKAVKPVMEDYKDKIHQARQDKEDKLDKILTSEQKNKMKEFKVDKDKAEKNWWQF